MTLRHEIFRHHVALTEIAGATSSDNVAHIVGAAASAREVMISRRGRSIFVWSKGNWARAVKASPVLLFDDLKEIVPQHRHDWPPEPARDSWPRRYRRGQLCFELANSTQSGLLSLEPRFFGRADTRAPHPAIYASSLRSVSRTRSLPALSINSARAGSHHSTRRSERRSPSALGGRPRERLGWLAMSDREGVRSASRGVQTAHLEVRLVFVSLFQHASGIAVGVELRLQDRGDLGNDGGEMLIVGHQSSPPPIRRGARSTPSVDVSLYFSARINASIIFRHDKIISPRQRDQPPHDPSGSAHQR